MRGQVLRLRAWGAAISAIGVLHVAVAFADSQAERTRAAQRLVEEALRQEIQGTDEQRSATLQSALEQLPRYAPALWHSGHVLDRNQWRTLDEVAALARDENRLANYNRKRDQTPETMEGQLALATWCARQRLPDQRRAHLTQVLELDPDHAEARRQLGYRSVDGVWMTEQEIAQAKNRARQAAVNMRKWEPTLRAIRKGLAYRSQRHRQAATERLMAIDDPTAIGPMEVMFSRHNEQTARLMVNALASMKAREASLVLARQGMFSPWKEVREAATRQLRARDLHSFVPELLSAMGSPVQSRAELYRAPTGRLVYRHTFTREGRDENQETVLETEYTNNDRSRESGMARAQQFLHAAGTAQRRERAVAQQNLAIQQFNDRVCSVLSNASGEQLPASPDQWWAWWNDYNEVYTVGYKPVQRYYNRDQVAVSSGTSPGGRSTFECLVAGTPVWTESGPKPVEQISVGDRVLAQDPNTGELAFKPVLRTTERAPTHLVKFDVGDESVHCSGGHPFWVSGEGWVKARDLTPSARLHAVTGTHVIDCIEQTGFEPTYNLIVADFHTYFVGQGKILSHDNTIREPTEAVVPGLIHR